MSLSRVRLFVSSWTIQSMELSRPEYWTGYPFPSPGDLPNPGIKSRSPTLQADSLPAEPPGKPIKDLKDMKILRATYSKRYSSCKRNLFHQKKKHTETIV